MLLLFYLRYAFLGFNVEVLFDREHFRQRKRSENEKKKLDPKKLSQQNNCSFFNLHAQAVRSKQIWWCKSNFREKAGEYYYSMKSIMGVNREHQKQLKAGYFTRKLIFNFE